MRNISKINRRKQEKLIRDLLEAGCEYKRGAFVPPKQINLVEAHREEVGPWSYSFETDDGEVVELGYEGASDDSHDGGVDRWAEDFGAHDMLQAEINAMEADIMSAYRAERMRNILLWIARANVKQLRRGRAKFWRRVLASRKMCASDGLWMYCYLTKQQVDTVFAAFEWRLTGGSI